MKFADIKNDVGFRKIFGNPKKAKILISFLNAVLKLEGEQRIVELKFENPYQFPRLAGEKASIVDVRATEESGRQFIVEMQVADVNGFDKRVQYYASRDYSMQIGKGEDYKKLKPTVFVGILNFKYFKGSDYLSYHSLLDEKTLEHKLKDIRFAFIELPKFKKADKDIKSLIDKWAYFLKNAEKLDAIPTDVDDEGLRAAYEDSDQHKWKREDLIAYDNASIAIQDERGRLSFAVETAVAAAVEEAERATREKSNNEKDTEFVLRLSGLGKEAAEIALLTGLDEARVRAILALSKH